MQKDELFYKSERLSRQTQQLSQQAQQLYQQESGFVGILNDDQLDTYQRTVQIFKSDDIASQELARRNLQKALDPNKYAVAIQLLSDKVAIRHACSNLESDYKFLQNDRQSLEKDTQRFEHKQERQEDADAMRDYMLMNAIIQSGHRR